jgi:hypothetical protein
MQAQAMWKQLWKKWTLDKPAAFGDLLWQVLVVQFAAFLDRLTLRQIVAFIPAVILVVAYAHSIPIPPELMLVGDVLAYIDIFSVILLLGMLTRIAAVWLFVRQATEHAVKLVHTMLAGARRFDFRHGREGGARNQKRIPGRCKADDELPAIQGLAWA